MVSSKFHFREINWIIYFPGDGNEGREYPSYGVKYLNRAGKSSQPGKAINLIDVLNSPEIRDHFPHTVGYYLESKGLGETFTPKYLEEWIIRNNEEFYRFLRMVGVQQRIQPSSLARPTKCAVIIADRSQEAYNVLEFSTSLFRSLSLLSFSFFL